MTSLLKRRVTCSDANCAASGLARQMAKAPFWRAAVIGYRARNVTKKERGGATPALLAARRRNAATRHAYSGATFWRRQNMPRAILL